MASAIYRFFFFLMIRRPPRSTLDRSSAASDVYKRQIEDVAAVHAQETRGVQFRFHRVHGHAVEVVAVLQLSLIHISEPTRPY